MILLCKVKWLKGFLEENYFMLNSNLLFIFNERYFTEFVRRDFTFIDCVIIDCVVIGYYFKNFENHGWEGQIYFGTQIGSSIWSSNVKCQLWAYTEKKSKRTTVTLSSRCGPKLFKQGLSCYITSKLRKRIASYGATVLSKRNKLSLH